MKKPDVVLHIGLHKTGTTFLQQEIYPHLEGVNYKAYYNMQNYHLKKGKINLISCENLSGSLLQSIKFDALERYALLHGLKALYPDARIIIGFREKNSWLRSVYQQHIKEGRLYLTFNSFLHTIPDEYLDFCSYEQMIRQLFKNVYVYRFEDFQRDPHGVVHNICDFIGVSPPVFSNNIWNERWSERKIRLGKIRSFLIMFSRRVIERL